MSQIQHTIEYDGKVYTEPQPPADPNNCPVGELEDYLYRKQAFDAILERAALEAGERPQQSEDPLYKIPMDELFAKAEQERIETEQKERDAQQAQNAYTFMANEPRYKKTPKNGQLMYDFIQKHRMKGTVSDLALAFDVLSEKGELELNTVEPAPKKIWTREELMAMPLEEAKACIEQMGRDGIF